MPKTKRRAPGFAEQPSSAFMAKRKRRAAASPAFLRVPVTSAQKKLIERAASMSGVSIAEFAADSVEDAARKLMSGNQTVILDAKYAASFAKAFLKPPRPNKALRDAAKRYLARVKG